MKQFPLPVEELIRRFRNGESSPEEIRLLQQWIAQLDMTGDAIELSPEELNAMKVRMYRGITSRPAVVVKHPGKIIRRILVAAGWLVLVTSAVLLWSVSRKAITHNHTKQPLLAVIESNRSGIRKIMLPDSTVVCLNSNSRLEFDPQQFNREQRYVKLSGEGFFEVTKNAAKPFIVETGNLRTRVLGTAFNIEAYKNESEIRVSLVHGKIALDDTSTQQSTVLSPNHSLRYSKQTKSWHVSTVDAATVALWTKGWLVFNEVPLQEAIERLREKYNLAIEYNPRQLQHKRITASFQDGTWSTILENILFVHGLHYRKVGEKVIIE